MKTILLLLLPSLLFAEPAITICQLGANSTANMVSIWHCNEKTGTTIFDSVSGHTAYQADGTVVLTTAGKFDGRIVYDADASTCGVHADFSTTGDFSVGFWVKLDAIGDRQTPICKGTLGINGSDWIFEINTDIMRLDWVVGNADPRENYTFETGVWYFIVGTYQQSSATAWIYINGVELGSDTGSGTRPNTAGRSIIFGAQHFNGYVIPLVGSLDEPFYLNRTLPEAEVYDIHHRIPRVN